MAENTDQQLQEVSARVDRVREKLAVSQNEAKHNSIYYFSFIVHSSTLVLQPLLTKFILK